MKRDNNNSNGTIDTIQIRKLTSWIDTGPSLKSDMKWNGNVEDKLEVVWVAERIEETIVYPYKWNSRRKHKKNPHDVNCAIGRDTPIKKLLSYEFY